MKILHIVPSYKPAYIYGGPIESVSKLCEGLAAAGHTVHVFTTTANGDTELDVQVGVPLQVDGVQVTYFKRITKDPTHISTTLWKQLYAEAGTYDIVNIQSWWNILVIVAARICQLKKVPVIVSPRGMLSKYIFESGQSRIKKGIHHLVGRKILSKSWFHATAQSEYAECREIIPGWKGFIQPNILSLPDIPLSPADNKIFTLVFMSRIHPKKGIEILLHALSKITFPVRLEIAGSGEEDYIASLKNLAVDLGIEENIVWLGWQGREDKFRTLMKADLFVLVSRNENFANVVVESLHMGTPVLLSRDVALSAFVAAQELGWICSLQADDVAEMITTAARDLNKRLQISAHSRAVIAANFSPEKLVKSYLGEYQRIIEEYSQGFAG